MTRVLIYYKVVFESGVTYKWKRLIFLTETIFRLEFFSGSEKRTLATGSEQSRKSSSASSLDASREGRDRRRRNKKKIPRRQNSTSQRRNDEPLNGVTSSSGIVINNSITTLNESASISYFKTSPVIVEYPIGEELESSSVSPPASFQMSFQTSDYSVEPTDHLVRTTDPHVRPSDPNVNSTDRTETNPKVFQVEMMTTAAGVDTISFIDSSNCCTLKIDTISRYNDGIILYLC